MDFGDALRALKSGARVAREGWNGKGMWLVLIHPGNAMHVSAAGRFDMQPCIGMKTAQNQMQPGWLASQADMLATDWCEVSESEKPELVIYDEKKRVTRALLDAPVEHGPWQIRAHVETRTRQRVPDLREPLIEPGDIWYRVVVSVETIEEGDAEVAGGEFSSSWCYSLESAVEAIRRIGGVEVRWTETVDADDTHACARMVYLAQSIDDAVARYRVAESAP